MKVGNNFRFLYIIRKNYVNIPVFYRRCCGVVSEEKLEGWTCSFNMQEIMRV